MEEMSYVFSFTFFVTAAHFLLALVVASISHFVTAATKFSCCSSNKKNVSFVFYLSLQITVALFLFEFRWPAAFSLFLCLSLALYSKFVDMTINLSLILQKTGIKKQFPLSAVVFTDSLDASALQDAGGYAISRQNNLELHLGQHTC